MNDRHERTGSALEEATDWLLRLKDVPDDPALSRDFASWLNQSSEHRAAWQRANQAWQLLGEIPASPHPADSRRKADATPASRAPLLASFISVAAIALLLALAYPVLTRHWHADYVTPTGESRRVALADGSVIELGADSAIDVDLATAQRRATLLSGEAFFEIAKDPARPFQVLASGVEVSVTGTAFNVRLSSSTAEVEVSEGSVAVSTSLHDRMETVRVAPNEMVAVDLATRTMTKAEIEADDIAAWRAGRLFVRDASIGSVIEQIRRYHSAWIAIPDSRLADKKVTGLYDLHDPDRALRALVRPYGGKVREISPYLRIVSGP
ncbi:FecR family protein [Rhodoligotrophos defluvii]|uniref:FecR family protein n=1 Tax=Rhodoligotrophos defluvii TaxID=2561934 RepID=UPI0010C94499|nr:FecR family protein [Rhodoligotrophos defluvii]